MPLSSSKAGIASSSRRENFSSRKIRHGRFVTEEQQLNNGEPRASNGLWCPFGPLASRLIDVRRELAARKTPEAAFLQRQTDK